MSQNKTIVPGVDYDNLGKTEYNNEAFNDFYSRSGNDDNRTYIPGVAAKQPQAEVSAGAVGAVPTPIGMTNEADSRHFALQNRVVVGVLFSLSHGLLGEMFPLYLGRNIVGYTENCDVRLLENTVSSEHAIIYIKKDESVTGYNITITDYNSTYGTLVNNLDGRYETLQVNENDVLTIGKHYRLLVKMFNTDKAALQEEPEFEAMQNNAQVAMAQPSSASNYSSNVSNDFYTPSSKDEQSSARTVIY